MIPVLIRNPHLIFRLRASVSRAADAFQKENARVSELASLAVDPDWSGRGLGKALVHAFLETSRQRGADTVYLTTDAVDNLTVNQFYQRLGFELHRVFETPAHRLMNEYHYVFTTKCDV